MRRPDGAAIEGEHRLVSLAMGHEAPRAAACCGVTVEPQHGDQPFRRDLEFHPVAPLNPFSHKYLRTLKDEPRQGGASSDSRIAPCACARV